MNSSDLGSYKDLYLKTASLNLEQLSRLLSELSGNLQDKKIIEEVFMVSHSLKSKHYAMNYKSFGKLCAIFENYFYSVKEHKTTVSRKVIQKILEIIPKLRMSFQNIKKYDTEIDLSLEIKDLSEIINISS